MKVRTALGALTIGLPVFLAAPAVAGVIGYSPNGTTLGGTIVPLVVAGAPPDSPADRVDPNLPTSPFSGVVSINIRYDGESFICSGTLVSKRDVVTAGHCVDTDGNGHIVDISQPFSVSGKDVRVVFNSEPNPGDPGRAVITATGVSMHPDYQGFGNCPYATTTDFCVNDDIAVVHMGQDAPATAQIYKVYGGLIGTGALDNLVGYGRSGDGINGYTTGPDFRIKRSGQNIIDLFDANDETHFSSGPLEVWYSDFDGGGKDYFCTTPGIAVCTSVLANDKEANIGGGDSGGPSFLFDGNEYLLFGNNTFGGTPKGAISGSFGTYFGGMLIAPYIDYLQGATDGAIQVVPEPGTLLLVGLGFAGFATRRRKPA